MNAYRIFPYDPASHPSVYFLTGPAVCCRPRCGQPAKYRAESESAVIDEAILCPRHAGLFMARHNVDITPVPDGAGR